MAGTIADDRERRPIKRQERQERHVPTRPVRTTPPAVRPGGVVDVVAPSSAGAADRLGEGLRLLDAWNLAPRVSPVVHQRRGHLAGESDAARAAALETALLGDAAAVWCARGGYGATRLLDLLDWERLRREARPKVFCGYSDVTALHQAIGIELGWVTFHGPIAQLSNSTPSFTKDGLRRAWTATGPFGALPLPENRRKWGVTPEALWPGVARGRVTGGNLSLLAALCGTRWALRTAGCILLLEDVHETPKRVDRMLVQLRLAGCLDGVAGIAFGHSPDCERDASDEQSLTLREVLLDQLAPLGVPLVYGWPFGHTPYQWTLPLGVEAEMNAAGGTLSLLEPACTG